MRIRTNLCERTEAKKGQRHGGGERDRPVSAYDLICANEDAGGCGC